MSDELETKILSRRAAILTAQEAVSSSLQLTACQYPCTFDRMIQEGTKKPAGTRAQAVYQNDDFHRPVQIAQVENRIGDVDQRSRRYQYGSVERFAPRMLDFSALFA